MTRPPNATPSPGDVYLSREQIASRVAELGAQIAVDYDGLRPVLVAPLKSSVVFLADLSRAIAADHVIDVIELAAYRGGRAGGVRLVKDLDHDVTGRHVLIVEDIVDTGLTLNYLTSTIGVRDPSSLACVTLLDRPYRRLVDDVPLRYVGFTVPDELFAGYGLGLDEKWRALPDLHVTDAGVLPVVTEAA